MHDTNLVSRGVKVKGEATQDNNWEEIRDGPRCKQQSKNWLQFTMKCSFIKKNKNK